MIATCLEYVTSATLHPAWARAPHQSKEKIIAAPREYAVSEQKSGCV